MWLPESGLKLTCMRKSIIMKAAFCSESLQMQVNSKTQWMLAGKSYSACHQAAGTCYMTGTVLIFTQQLLTSLRTNLCLR